MVYKHMITHFHKMKEVFVAKILLYKNLSHFCHKYYDLGDVNNSLKAYFLEVSCFSHLVTEHIVDNKK